MVDWRAKIAPGQGASANEAKYIVAGLISRALDLEAIETLHLTPAVW